MAGVNLNLIEISKDKALNVVVVDSTGNVLSYKPLSDFTNDVGSRQFTISLSGAVSGSETSCIDDGWSIVTTIQDHIHNIATINANGLMSAADKIKLDGMDLSAEENQDAFSSVLIDDLTNIVALTKTDQFKVYSGTGIMISPNTVNKSIMISLAATGVDADSLNGFVQSTLNEPNTLALRDGFGNFAANIITASLNGNANTSSKWFTPRTLTLIGDAVGSVSIDGSTNITLDVGVMDDSHCHSYTIYPSYRIYAGSGTSVVLSNDFGSLSIKNDDDSGYADLKVRNLTTTGTLTALQTTNMEVYDNVVVLNSDVISGEPTENGGLEIKRGSYASAGITWNETNDVWQCGLLGSESIIWTQSTDGSGSGLDADLLDGMQPTNANTVSTIVQRDASGNFSANIITAALSGNATSADKWSSIRTITLGGDATGSVSIDGSANATLTVTITNNSHEHSNYLLLTGGTITGQLISTLATGTSPLAVTSTTINTNLNADLLDGKHASEFALVNQTMYIGTTSVAINRASAALTLAGITLASPTFTSPILGTPASGTLTNCTFPTLNQNTTGSAAKWTTARTLTLSGDVSGSVSIDGSGDISLVTTIANDSHTHDATNITSGTLSGDRGIIAGSASSSFVKYTGTTDTDGALYGGTTAPTGTTRLNYSGYLYATRVYNAVYNDIAECFIPDDKPIIPHRIVECSGDRRVALAYTGSKCVIGIVSDSYASLMYGSEEQVQSGELIPVAMTGTVSVDADPIYYDVANIGDFIIPSYAGFARPISKNRIMEYAGSIVGKIIGKHHGLFDVLVLNL